MVSASTARVPADGEQELPRDLLSEIEQVHKRVDEGMAEMDEITREAVPDRFRFTRARFRISSASLARRQLFNIICADLLPRVSPADAERLHALQRSDRELMAHSAKHVARWTSETAQADWASYCIASREIRKRMRDVLGQELRVLTSLLQRHAGWNQRAGQ
jgi:hypothetical protein